MQYCTRVSKMYFEASGEPLTVDDGLRNAVTLGRNVEAVQAAYDRCHQFQERDPAELGDANGWLTAATAAGQPSALVMAAERQTQNPEIDTGSPDLLKQAIATLDPEALFMIGWYERLMPNMKSSWSGPRSVDALAWMYIGCRRGFDCSANADWVAVSCTGCQHAESTDALIESISGEEWPEVQQRVLEISAALESGRVDEVGF